jgi:hypothetical protein
MFQLCTRSPCNQRRRPNQSGRCRRLWRCLDHAKRHYRRQRSRSSNRRWSTTGIYINNPGGQVTIRDLTIHAANGYGIWIIGGDVHLENVLIVGNPNYGIYADGSGGNAVHVTTKNVTVTNAGNGGILLYGASGSIRDSVVRGGNYGIYVESAPGQAAVALVERCEISYNTLTGLTANNAGGPGAAVRVSDTVITGNATGISTVAGGQIITLRTNILTGNTTDGSTPFSISLK